jgi:parallel beta-helix repeat protein
MINRTGKRYLPIVFAIGYFLAALIVEPSFPGKALAATIRVPKDYPSIQKAMDAARKGDKIRVSQGIYFENVTMKEGVVLEGGWSKDFSRRDISAYVTTIDGKKKAGWVVWGADGATLDGFTVVNGTRIDLGDSTTGAGVHCKSTSPTIVNNTIKGNAPAGIHCSASSAVIKNNTIFDNEEAGIYVGNGCSVTIRGNTIGNNKKAGIASGGMVDSKIDVRNNTIHENGMAGIDGKMATGTVYNNIIYKNQQGGIRCVKAPMDIINNTIVANVRSGVIVEDPHLVPTIKNNIITHNEDSGIRAGGKGYFRHKEKGYSHNLLFSNNMTGDCYAGYLWCVRRQYGGYEDENSYLRRKDIIADPFFMDALHHDYHLQPRSPAIDAGDPDSKYEDLNFPPSLGSSVNDLGAYGGPFAISEKRKPNDAPEAQAGPSQQVYAGDRVILDGSGSSDPNGDHISFHWELVSKPKESKARLSKPGAIKPTFKADVAGKYSVQLVVKDRWGKSGTPHTIQLHALANRPPTANAGEVISNVYAGDSISLYGGGSKDADGDPLTYQWKLIFRPSGSQAELSEPKAVRPSLSVDALGCYAVQLIVNDGKVDSLPDTVYISTKHKAIDGKRNVPDEYPTIQTAVDAADPGDDIVVQKGTYKESIILDKSVNLIGIGWPTIDGESKEGDVNVIMIPYLGDTAGKVDGFIITGGGKGGMGHGINIWDSSPTIVNNKIFGCHHNAIGVHGREALTGKAKIYNNFIYENTIGIGNGRGSRAHIYENHIYNNRQVGVGSRGLASPRIERNYIYGNRIGVGAREVASPHIEGNHVYDNVTGIVIGPLSTVRSFAGDDIIMKNNLVFNNHQVGILITSFNLSRVIISNNTIDSNNHQHARTERSGGLVLGYPYQSKITAILENNIVTNNKFGGIVNYTGTELFPFAGATMMNNYNNVWNNENDHVGCTAGDRGFSKDPLFVSLDSVKNGGYYLSQKASGHASDSPCVEAGSGSAAKLGFQNKTTRTDKVGDTGIVDVGYHYPQNSAP